MTQRFEYTVLDMIESATRTILTKPVNLGGVGGVGGGVGGPPGGFVGRLAQFNVAYDTLEAATLSTLPSGVTGASGWSLVDNLNHIRYRLGALETGSGVLIVDEADGSPSVSPTSRITFSGAVVTDLGGGHALVTISGGGGGGLDTAAGDARYLKLDASNDPLTAQLDVIPSNPGDGGIYISTEGDAYPLDVEQISSTSANVTSPALYILQALDSTGNFNFGGHLIYGRRNRTGGGIFYTDLIRLETPSGVVFNVDKDGHAYDNGELLITEAPINGSSYNRKNGDWVIASGGSTLTVMEHDGSPIVTNVDTIRFSGAMVTDLGSGDALVTISGLLTDIHGLPVKTSFESTDEFVIADNDHSFLPYKVPGNYMMDTIYNNLNALGVFPPASTALYDFQLGNGTGGWLKKTTNETVIILDVLRDRCKATRSSAQTISSATDTRINFTTEDYDSNTMHDNSTNNTRITIKRSGIYIISAYVVYNSNATGIRSTQIWKNGGSVSINTNNAVSAGNHQVGLTDQLQLTVNDYIECNVYQSSGGNLDVNNATLAVACVALT
jgi:hypothetical protein